MRDWPIMSEYWEYLESVGFPFKKHEHADVDRAIDERMVCLSTVDINPPTEARYGYAQRYRRRMIFVDQVDDRFCREFPPNVVIWTKPDLAYDISLITDFIGDNERQRLSTIVNDKPSAYTIFEHEMKLPRQKRSTLNNVVETATKLNGTIPHRLREAFYKLVSEASVFGPLTARMIIEYVGATSVLDPCSGWGDRLAGALSVPTVKRYVGFDPNDYLQPAYNYLISRYSAGRDFRVNVQGAEIGIRRLPEKFDLVFTSPPYYRKEIYRSQIEQSSTYPTLQAWKIGFLYPMIRDGWNCLNVGGSMIIHISDLREMSVVRDMMYFMRNLPGFMWVGVIILAGRLEMPCWHAKRIR